MSGIKFSKFVRTPLNVGLQQFDATNLLFSQLIVMTKNEDKPFSSSFVFTLFIEIIFRLDFKFSNIWLENCSPHFKPIVYRQFVEDTVLHSQLMS